MDIASKIVALIVSAIGAGVTIYKTFFKGDHKRKQSYYISLLKPFIREYKNNNDINAIEFIHNTTDSVDDSIPKYIFYLAGSQTTNHNAKEKIEESNDCLRKVLIEDYFGLYPNERTKKFDFFDSVKKLLNYIYVLFSFLCIFVGALLVSSQFISLISNAFTNLDTLGNNLFIYLQAILLGTFILLVGVFPVLLSEWFSEDMYTVKKKRIQKIISNKIKRYDKRIDEYVL